MPLERYLRWKSNQRDVGCVFARIMARHADEHGQRAVVLTETEPRALAVEIANRIDAWVADTTAVAATLVLPGLIELPAVVAMAQRLHEQPLWHVTTRIVPGTPVGDVVAFNIARDIPFGSATVPSEALVLGPFPEAFPNTRCAPVTALELFVGTPPPLDFMGNPTSKGHLALVDITFPSPTAFERTVESTREARMASLGGIDDQRAKARVAFVIPIEMARDLGCAP